MFSSALSSKMLVTSCVISNQHSTKLDQIPYRLSVGCRLLVPIVVVVVVAMIVVLPLLLALYPIADAMFAANLIFHFLDC